MKAFINRSSEMDRNNLVLSSVCGIFIILCIIIAIIFIIKRRKKSISTNDQSPEAQKSPMKKIVNKTIGSFILAEEGIYSKPCITSTPHRTVEDILDSSSNSNTDSSLSDVSSSTSSIHSEENESKNNNKTDYKISNLPTDPEENEFLLQSSNSSTPKRANDVSLDFSLLSAQDLGEYHTEVEDESKTVLKNQNIKKDSTIIIEENKDIEETNERLSEENNAINNESVMDIYSFYETGKECDSYMFNTTINEREKPTNCYGQLFSNSHMPVAFFVSLLLRKFGNNH